MADDPHTRPSDDPRPAAVNSHIDSVDAAGPASSPEARPPRPSGACLHQGSCKAHPCHCSCNSCLIQCLHDLEGRLRWLLTPYFMDNPVVEATLDWAILTGLEWIQDGRAQGMGEFRSFRLARAALRFGHDMLRHEHTGWHTCHVAASEGMDSEDRESEPDPVLIDAVAMLRLQRGCLTPRQDEAVRLCYEEGLTEAEAARALGVARSSLRGILDRAYSNLREPWGDRVPLWLE